MQEKKSCVPLRFVSDIYRTLIVLAASIATRGFKNDKSYWEKIFLSRINLYELHRERSKKKKNNGKEKTVCVGGFTSLLNHASNTNSLGKHRLENFEKEKNN